MDRKRKNPPPRSDNGKKKFTAPSVESEPIFERRALACGKCRSGPHLQHACFRLPSVS